MSWQSDYRVTIEELLHGPDGNEKRVWDWFDDDQKKYLRIEEVPKRTAFVKKEIGHIEKKRELQKLRDDFRKDAATVGKWHALGMMHEVRKKIGTRLGFRWFMQDIVVKYYSNNVQSFVVAGAALLIITIGLRSLKLLPDSYVLVSLGIEFSLLCLWSISLFYVEEAHEAGRVTIDGFDELKQSFQAISSDMRTATVALSEIISKQEKGFSKEHLDTLQGIILRAASELSAFGGTMKYSDVEIAKTITSHVRASADVKAGKK